MKRFALLSLLAVFAATLLSSPPQAAHAAATVLTEGVQTAHPLPNDAGMGFYEYLPAGYGDGTEFPLILFFHGKGERGNGSTQLARVLENGPPMQIAEEGAHFPAIVISPQLPANKGAWQDYLTTPFMEYVLEHYDIDRSRIYVTGLSLGGGGAWRFAKAHPDLVAAVVPVCGTESSAGYEVLAGMPVWAFHNEGDPTVALGSSNSKLRVITGVNPLSNRPNDNYKPGYTGSFDGTQWVWAPGYASVPATSNPHFTVFESNSHNAWTRTYASQAMWDWMFAQQRSDS